MIDTSKEISSESQGRKEKEPVRASSRSSTKKEKVLVGTIGILFIVVVILGAAVVKLRQQQRSLEAPAEGIVQGDISQLPEEDKVLEEALQAAGEQGTTSEESQKKEPPKDPEAAKVRDEQRLKDIEVIRAALAGYYKDKGSYPEELSALVPQYLANLPANPQPGGIDYSYTPIGSSPYDYYDLAYELEIGTGTLSSGLHIASKDYLSPEEVKEVE